MTALKTTTGKARSNRRRPSREEKRAANRQRLLDAALEVFSERGYHGATIEEIVDASGLSNGALYYNFASKEELFLALFDQRIEARIAAVEATFGGAAAGDEEGERRVRRAALQGVRDIDDPREWAMFFEFVAHAARTPEFRRQFQRRARRLRQAFSRLLDANAGQFGGELALPADQVALAVAALTQGIAAQRITDPRAVPDELLGQLIVALLRGLTPS